MFPSVSSSSQNPNHSHFESTVTSFLSFPDSPSLSLTSSFDRVLHNLLYSSSGDDSVQDQLIDRTLHRVSLLLESTKRCSRKRAKVHNSISWFLPPDLTIKVFSMLDTKSLMLAMICCTMFKKCAMDPLCYSHVDLTTALEVVGDQVLRTMIHRAGKELRSLKLGCVSNSITSPLLTDLKIVGVYDSIEEVLEVLTRKCRFIEHLFLETRYRGVIADSIIKAFVTNCSNFTSLTLIHFNLTDEMVQTLVTGFPKLKYMNLSSTVGIDGSFLRDLGHSCKDNPLETLILRNYSLKESEVLEFLNSLIAGNFRYIRYIDISSYNGLACDGDERTSEPKLPLEKLKEERSDVTFVAKFPLTSAEFICWLLNNGNDEE